jgi:superfamily II DNA/RNA helicase
MQTFNETGLQGGLPSSLLRALERLGFNAPTPIQAQAIPPALQGHDILGTAQTGTGKTFAFGIPLITSLLNNLQGSALVLLPTRELAAQVISALNSLVGESRMPVALLIGGESMQKQFKQLKARPRLIVGTPGRINDHLQRRTLNLRDTRFLVLDESDRMLDMGFGVQLDAIAKYLTAKRQTLMFSATLPKNIIRLAEKYLSNPVRISVGSTTAPVTKVTQELVNVTDAEKFPRLLTELQSRTGSILIFVKTKRNAEKLADKLCQQNHGADALHGNLRQNKRDKVIRDFRQQKYRILVATDIAARGLDIPHIEHVINYDLPQSPEDYIHRIGRTARAGAEGAALNLLTAQDHNKWRAIQRLLNPHEKAAYASERPSKTGKHRSRRPQRWQRKKAFDRRAA